MRQTETKYTIKIMTYIINILGVILVKKVRAPVAVSVEVHPVALRSRAGVVCPVLQLVRHPRVDLVGDADADQLPFAGALHVLESQ